MYKDIEYPLRLCVELLHYAGLGANGKTEYMTIVDIREAAGVFFSDSQIEEARKILCGEPVVIEG